MTVRILQGDCREVLAALPERSAHCCVTSPPYFGLRDYGCDGQIGLEKTPAEYVEQLVTVFREVRRVLRDDGTLWLNLGDSYAGSWGARGRGDGTSAARPDLELKHGTDAPGRHGFAPLGIKPKDLIGIPWAVATALRDPYYTGRMTRERDRAWIAAMIDGEGTICGFHHIRADNGSPRTGAHIAITNSNVPLLDEMHRIWPTSRSEHQRPGAGHLGTRATYRWLVHGAENKMQFLREVYPYLIAKKRQAMVAYNLLLLMPDAKKVGHSPQRDASREQRKGLTDLLSALNQGVSVDLPSWLVEPPSVFEPGYYLRQDVIWSKPNPMPESVTDRCTKAHEYVFLLSKAERYYFDAEAIAEEAINGTAAGFAPAGGPTPGLPEQSRRRRPSVARGGFAGKTNALPGREAFRAITDTRNKRSVWTIATRPFSEAHFATMAPELAETCIKAGCPKGGTVLDPFGGAGTTALVADRMQRDAMLIELNPQYAAIAQRRIAADAPLFADVQTEAA